MNNSWYEILLAALIVAVLILRLKFPVMRLRKHDWKFFSSDRNDKKPPK